MRSLFILMTAAQSILSIFLVITHHIDTLICLSTLLGLTGGRQAFSYLLLTDIVPMTHISFVSMWFSGSLALVVLFQCAFFFFWPHWQYFVAGNVVFGIFITIVAFFMLLESPMHLLIKGNSTQATKNLEWIKKFNKLGISRPIDLYDINQRICHDQGSKSGRSFWRYALCTASLWNIVILVLMQLIISSSLYLLWFEYQFIEGKIFQHTLFASSSFFVGCLLGGVFLSKISTNRIKTSKGKIRYLRCVFITMFSIALFGSTLLILIDKF